MLTSNPFMGLIVSLCAYPQPKTTRPEDMPKPMEPSTTLFVVNFDTRDTRTRDIERHFDRYGKLRRVEIKRNYAFVQFESIEQAQDAVRATNGRAFNGQTITVEYVRNSDPKANARGGWVTEMCCASDHHESRSIAAYRMSYILSPQASLKQYWSSFPSSKR